MQVNYFCRALLSVLKAKSSHAKEVSNRVVMIKYAMMGTIRQSNTQLRTYSICKGVNITREVLKALGQERCEDLVAQMLKQTVPIAPWISEKHSQHDHPVEPKSLHSDS